MDITISALFIGANAALLAVLGLNVVRFRLKNRVSLGDGGVKELERAMRAHGNAAETIPAGLLVILATELMGAPGWVVFSLGLMLTLGRLAHAASILYGISFGFRQIGMVLSWSVMLFGGIALMGWALTSGA